MTEPGEPIFTEAIPTMNKSLSTTLEATTSESSNFLQSTTFKVVMLILILAVLGINLFQYLANTTDLITNYFSEPVLQFLSNIGLLTLNTTKTVAIAADKGVKATSDTIKNVVTGTIDETTSLGKSIQHKKKRHKPEEDSALTIIQSSQSKRKSGYCYIGEDRGFRSCIKVDDSPCISGMIYPTKEHCIHPHLRH